MKTCWGIWYFEKENQHISSFQNQSLHKSAKYSTHTQYNTHNPKLSLWLERWLLLPLDQNLQFLILLERLSGFCLILYSYLESISHFPPTLHFFSREVVSLNVMCSVLSVGLEFVSLSGWSISPLYTHPFCKP